MTPEAAGGSPTERPARVGRDSLRYAARGEWLVKAVVLRVFRRRAGSQVAGSIARGAPLRALRGLR